MYKAEKYRRDTAETTGSARFSANFHGITSEDASQPPFPDHRIHIRHLRTGERFLFLR